MASRSSTRCTGHRTVTEAMQYAFDLLELKSCAETICELVACSVHGAVGATTS
jgi:hypothetical protein